MDPIYGILIVGVAIPVGFIVVGIWYLITYKSRSKREDENLVFYILAVFVTVVVAVTGIIDLVDGYYGRAAFKLFLGLIWIIGLRYRQKQQRK
jgi:hypothetical protein